MLTKCILKRQKWLCLPCVTKQSNSLAHESAPTSCYDRRHESSHIVSWWDKLPEEAFRNTEDMNQHSFHFRGAPSKPLDSVWLLLDESILSPMLVSQTHRTKRRKAACLLPSWFTEINQCSSVFTITNSSESIEAVRWHVFACPFWAGISLKFLISIHTYCTHTETHIQIPRLLTFRQGHEWASVLWITKQIMSANT